MTEQQLQLTVSGQGGKTSSGSARLVQLSPAERWRRALRTAGILALAAVLTLLIPIVHFFAPPLLLLLASVVLVHHLGQDQMLLDGIFQCAQCAKSCEIESQPPRWPLELNCRHCRRALRVEIEKPT